MTELEDVLDKQIVYSHPAKLEAAVRNINFLKAVVKAIADKLTSNGYRYSNSSVVSHFTSVSGDALIIELENDWQPQADGYALRVYLRDDHTSVLVTGVFSYDLYTGAYQFTAHFTAPEELSSVSDFSALSAFIRGSYKYGNFSDIEIINYNDDFARGTVYLDRMSNPYIAYATNIHTNEVEEIRIV